MNKDKKWEDYSQARNFSEPKNLDIDKKCKGCGEPVPKLALAFSNTAAIEHGYCCWMCCLSHLGSEKAYRILEDKAKQNQASRGKL